MNEKVKTLLLADSQIDEITALKLAVESEMPDVKVITADRGESALQLAAERPLVAAVADMRLSDMSGIKLLMKLKAEAPHVTTMLMTDAATSRIQALCLEAGIDLCLQKPVSVSRLRAALGKGAESSGMVFRGTLDQLSVPEVLQLVGDREPPMLMRIDSLKGQGAIEICKGEVVHARVNGQIGEPAIYELVSWREGHFEVVDVLWHEERTIAKPLHQILLRAAAIEQERQDQAAQAIEKSESKAKPEETFFAPNQRTASVSSVWEHMPQYNRSAGQPVPSHQRARAVAMATMPAFSAYYKERGGGEPLRLKAKDPRPPRAPEPATVEVSPPSRSHPGPRRGPIKLPSARRLMAAGAIAACALFALVNYSGLFSIQYGRNLAPAFMDLVQDVVPGGARASRTSAPVHKEARREAPNMISNNSLTAMKDAGSALHRDAAQAAGVEAVPVTWAAYSIGVRDDDRLLVGVNHVGVRGDVFDQLGLDANPWVELRCTKGRQMGGYAVRLDDGPEAVVLSRAMAQGFGYGTEDLTEVRMRPVEWAQSVGQSLSFNANRELPGKFCAYWYSVGLSLKSLKAAGLVPGAHAVIRGPAGLQTVRVQLVDRGQPDEIWLSKPVRDAVGGAEDGTSLTLFPKG